MSLTASELQLQSHHSPLHNKSADSILSGLLARREELLAMAQKPKIKIEPIGRCDTRNREKIKRCREKIQKAEEDVQGRSQQIIKCEQKILERVCRAEEIQQMLKGQATQIRNLFENQPAWIWTKGSYAHHRLRLIDLESEVMQRGLIIPKVLAQFYYEQCLNADLPRSLDSEVDLVEWVVRNKLVNKLYSFIIKKKEYRGEQDDELDVSGCPASRQVQHKDHRIWMNYMKVLKQLEKRSHTDDAPAGSGFKTKVIQVVTSANQSKKNLKQIRAQIKGLQATIAECNQDIQLKKQFIQQVSTRLATLQAERIQSSELNPEGASTKQIPENYQIQLKQIEQAIEYFKVKRDTSASLKQVSQNKAKLKTEKDVLASAKRYHLLNPTNSSFTTAFAVSPSKISFMASPRNVVCYASPSNRGFNRSLRKASSGKKIWK